MPEPAHLASVYSSVASSQWSNKQVRQKIEYRWSDTVIVQHLYINYTLCVFFYSVIFFSLLYFQGISGVRLGHHYITAERRGVRGGGGVKVRVE